MTSLDAIGRMVTPENLSAVYRHMATMKPNSKTGFTWADKMSVTHVCDNYDSIWLELVQAKQQRCLNDTTRDRRPLRTSSPGLAARSLGIGSHLPRTERKLSYSQ